MPAAARVPRAPQNTRGWFLDVDVKIFSVITPATALLRKTAMFPMRSHRRLGAKMVNFGGWDMPLEYSGILSEHEAVRTRAGLFDVSHMGEIEIRGSGALLLVEWVTCNNAARLSVGQAHYSGLMTERGTFVDDILVHKISDTHYSALREREQSRRRFSGKLHRLAQQVRSRS